MEVQTQTGWLIALFGVLALVCAPAGAQDEGPDPDRLARIEAELALKASQKRIAELEQKNAALQDKVARMGSAIAAANASAEEVLAENARLRQEMDALNVTALDPSAEGLRKRLKEALATLASERAAVEKLSTHVVDLTEAARAYRASAIARDPNADRVLAEALRKATLQMQMDVLPDLQEKRMEGARIVAARRDLELVVLNVGAESGARIGMPLRLMRKDRVVGEAVVVDVRDHVAGAVLQKLVRAEDLPQVGDLAVLDFNALRK